MTGHDQDADADRIDAALSRIKEKLERFRHDGWHLYADQFGVKSHKFRLHPPAPEEGVAEFEARHGIKLPAAYRAFTCELGHGGAGPDYGILPLARWDDHFLDDPIPEILVETLVRSLLRAVEPQRITPLPSR